MAEIRPLCRPWRGARLPARRPSTLSSFAHSFYVASLAGGWPVDGRFAAMRGPFIRRLRAATAIAGVAVALSTATGAAAQTPTPTAGKLTASGTVVGTVQRGQTVT